MSFIFKEISIFYVFIFHFSGVIDTIITWNVSFISFVTLSSIKSVTLSEMELLPNSKPIFSQQFPPVSCNYLSFCTRWFKVVLYLKEHFHYSVELDVLGSTQKSPPAWKHKRCLCCYCQISRCYNSSFSCQRTFVFRGMEL